MQTEPLLDAGATPTSLPSGMRMNVIRQSAMPSVIGHNHQAAIRGAALVLNLEPLNYFRFSGQREQEAVGQSRQDRSLQQTREVFEGFPEL